MPVLAVASGGDIAISEVFFDPSGTDTGLEYIVIKNFGSADVNLGGWDLYPAGVGYFNFPNFTLAHGEEVKIHIRASGSADAANLYHGVASANMGNSSGSVALFSSTAHTKEMVVSYVRYQKPGSSESKTWESTASDAGIWTAGDFIDISDFLEGQVLTLTNFNQKNSSAGWGAGSGVENTSPPPTPENSDEEDDSAEAPAQSGGKVTMAESESKLKADAGDDRTVLAGAEVAFEASAEGFNEDSFNKARYSWNFGDGFLGEGKKVAHSFAYPGVYTVFLTVSSAGIAVSDSVKITTVANPVIMSEIKLGEFFEIYNASPRKIDFSGFGIVIDAPNASTTKPFHFSAGTFLAPYAYLALAAANLGFDIPQNGLAKILYPNSKILFSSNFDASQLISAESISFVNNEWVKSEATPGAKNEVIKISPASTSVAKTVSQKNSKNESIGVIAKKTEEPSIAPNDFTASSLDAGQRSLFFGEYVWLIIGIGGGIIVGLAYIAAKRYLV